MFISDILAPISTVKGVGPATAKQLTNLGITSVGDMLRHWPKDWEDRTVFNNLSDYKNSAKINCMCTVLSHSWFGFGKMRTLKISIVDDEGTSAHLLCFNRPFLEKQFPEQSRVQIYGSFFEKYGSLQSSSFEIQAEAEHTQSKIVPVYALTNGITQKIIRKILHITLSEYGRGIDSELPPQIRKLHNIPTKQEILFFAHKPNTLKEAIIAHESLIFEEFFQYQYALVQRSLKRRGKLPSINASIDEFPKVANKHDFRSLPALQKQLLERLPFKLTEDQTTVLFEINDDLTCLSTSMMRLLQGDVGSGKTLIAFFAALAVIQKGEQAVLLAPTELLARQHAQTASMLLEPLGIKIAFLTGNVKASGRTKLLSELKEGQIDLIIGTHALFSAPVAYKNLSLVIIDEQHRFGVLQRNALLGKGAKQGKEPHLLMMSATPIPRTLAISTFGDMDISVIKSLPAHRKPIITHLSKQGNERKVYDFIAHELSCGHQAYFVYPRIEEDENVHIKSAEAMFQLLSTEMYKNYSCALLHSKVQEEEQKRIMNSFKKGEIQILVATSVVEVGVDVANATCMVVEHAERFGLAALHQLRGRVGRSELQSYCFFVYSSSLTQDGKDRLRVLHETNDGFKIAEADLSIRGPGNICGLEQSGYIAFSIGDPIKDGKILEKARIAAINYISSKDSVS